MIPHGVSEKNVEIEKKCLTAGKVRTIMYKHDCGCVCSISPGSNADAARYNQGVDMFDEDIYAQCKEY